MFFRFDNHTIITKDEPEKTTQDYINLYKGQCVADEVPMTLSGLSHALGYPTLDHLKEAANNDIVIQLAILEIQKLYEENLTKKGGSPSGAQFALSSMFEWKNEQTINLTGETTEDKLKEMSTDDLQALLKKLGSDGISE